MVVGKSAAWWSDAVPLSFRSRFVVAQCCSAVGVADRDMLASTVVVASAIILSAQKRVVAVGDEVKNEARETTLHC